MKKISIALIAALFFGILLVSLILAADSSKPITEKTANIDNKKAQPKEATKAVPVVANKREGGRPEFRGEINGDRVEDSYRFLEMNKDSFGLINPRQELRARGVVGDEYSVTAKFDQVVNGVKVRYGGYNIHFSADGSTNGSSGQIDPEARKIDTNPAISEEQAKQIAFTDTLNINAKPEAVDMELLIARFPDGLRLVWSFGVIGGGGDIGSWKYIVDAKTGKILVVSSALR